jgi:hypothetical protein
MRAKEVLSLGAGHGLCSHEWSYLSRLWGLTLKPSSPREHRWVIGLRLKRGGMFWTVQGADAIIALRCCKLSGRFEDFWERRAATRTG